MCEGKRHCSAAGTVSTTKSELIFDGWEPRNYKTKSGWQAAFRRVENGEGLSATVEVRRLRRLESTGTKYEAVSHYGLYHISQTRPVKKTPLNLARHDYFRAFAQRADRQRYIRWTKGAWVTEEDGLRYWDDTLDDWGWRTYTRWLPKQLVVDHVRGKEIVGVFGAESSSYLLIDLDLHGSPLTLFLRRLSVLLDALHGKYGCHFQVSNTNSGGVHLILFFGRPSPLSTRRKWVISLLEKLQLAHPHCNFFRPENRKLNIEIFPSPTNPHRLPLARERTMLLDKPLELVEYRGRKVQDVVSYLNWLNDPKRTYMAKDDVYRYVVERLNVTSWSSLSTRKSDLPDGPQAVVSSMAGPTNVTSTTPTTDQPIFLKNKTRWAIVSFWLHGEIGHFRHLNAAILITLRALRAEGVEKERAVELLTGYVEALPNEEISSRLGDLPAVVRDINRAADRVWLEAAGNNVSGQKWQAVVDHWGKVGFLVSDKSTWTIGKKALEVVVDCDEIEFNEDERSLVIKELAPVLVGNKQANKKEKQDEVISAVAYFLRYVRCCDREIPRNALPVILSGFNLKLGNHVKQAKFLRLLTEWEWIYVRADYYCPLVHGGKAPKGRARAYGIGPAMAGKFGLPSVNTEQEGILDLYSVSHFLWDGKIDGISDLDDQIFETCQPWPT
ncbi:MAG: hypothetical protein GXX96_17590 [Planctomycetaceae bacterium]|nr:hypothetical protein [Planctomycetaceae bacterium]